MEANGDPSRVNMFLNPYARWQMTYENELCKKNIWTFNVLIHFVIILHKAPTQSVL